MSDKYAADEKLLLNAQEVTNQLRHLADNEIDSDSFAVITENYNGRETEFEMPITDLAIDAANLVDAMVDALELRDKRVLELLAERDADKARIAELEAREVKLPPLSDDLIAILGRPNFTCAHLAELMRKGGDEIRRKAEHEQAAVIYWFLSLYLEHGNKWEAVAKADIQSRVASLNIEGE